MRVKNCKTWTFHEDIYYSAQAQYEKMTLNFIMGLFLVENKMEYSSKYDLVLQSEHRIFLQIVFPLRFWQIF